MTLTLPLTAQGVLLTWEGKKTGYRLPIHGVHPDDLGLQEICERNLDGTVRVKYRRPPGDPMLEEPALRWRNYFVRSFNDHLLTIAPFQMGSTLLVQEVISQQGVFKAGFDGQLPEGDHWLPLKKMPPEKARLQLTITGLRVQALRDVTDEDARNEGHTEDKPLMHFQQDFYHRFRKLPFYQRPRLDCTVLYAFTFQAHRT